MGTSVSIRLTARSLSYELIDILPIEWIDFFENVDINAGAGGVVC